MKKFKPTNPLVNASHTDLYQLTMAYGYWKAGRHEEPAVFELFFRKNPFGGEFTFVGGQEECIRYINDFHFTEKQIKYIRTLLPDAEPEFFKWLSKVGCSEVKVYAVKEGTMVFPREPIMRIEGPLAICQLLETTLLNLTNFASLIMTNAVRHRLAAGQDKLLLEFGLRRAQGPDGALSASRYAYMGGFDGTSNVQAGALFGIPVSGTMAHAFIQSFSDFTELKSRSILDATGKNRGFFNLVMEIRKSLGYANTNNGELASFIAYAQAFPKKFLALVDTYNTLKSGVPNFICVAMALLNIGYKPVGVRIDSGDLAYLSKEIRKMLIEASEKYKNPGIVPYDLSTQKIMASNDINETVLKELNSQGHEIDGYGIGTYLATCWAQPALGCVYKLVEIKGKPRAKLSEDAGKITIPGKKEIWRLIGGNNKPLCDILTRTDEQRPQIGQKILAKDPFNEIKSVCVVPSKIERLLNCVWDAELKIPFPSIIETRAHVLGQLENTREDHLRAANPTKYKVSVSRNLYGFLHELIKKESPISEIS